MQIGTWLCFKTLQKKRDCYTGYSIGSGVASHLACTNDIEKLFLISPYESLEKFSKRYGLVSS